MAEFLEDGSVIPTQYSVERAGNYGSSWDNSVLRVGEVQEILYPDDQRNISKQVIEYRVSVQHHDTVMNAGVKRDYLNCYLINPLGGLADKLHYTLRGENSSNRKGLFGLGSKVLVLCINGLHRNAIIIGGVRDKTDTADKDNGKALGHHFHFVFNGLDCAIDKAGGLTVTGGGATKIDGKVADDVDTKLAGTMVKLLADGTFQVSTLDAEEVLVVDKKGQRIELYTKDGEQFFRLNHKDHKVQLQAKSELDMTVTDGRVKVKSQGVDVGDATDAWVLGTTYRRAESQMNQKLAAMNKALQAALAVAASTLNSGGGSMIIPIVGAVIASPQIVAAGAALQVAAQIALQMGQAIDMMEATADTYLSKKNTTD